MQSELVHFLFQDDTLSYFYRLKVWSILVQMLDLSPYQHLPYGLQSLKNYE